MVAIPFRTPVGLGAQVLAVDASECDLRPSWMCSMAPDIPLAGVARIWLFLVHGEKRRFKGHTLFVDDMTDYVMPVLVGLYLAFAIAVMAVTPIMAS